MFQLPSVAGNFQFMCSFSIKTGNFLTRWVNVSFSRTLLHWVTVHCLFLNCQHSTYSAKMIITLQSTDVPHVTGLVIPNSGTNLQPSISRHNRKCRQFKRTCHSHGLKVPPVDVESHYKLSCIPHVTLEIPTPFPRFLLNFN